MARWEPDTRGRLSAAALELFAEVGYDGVTAAQIAARAGLTERTFFRYFADKRDVLFQGGEMLGRVMAAAVADVPPSATTYGAVRAALVAAAGVLQEDPARFRLRDEIVTGHADLRERELTKHAALADALADALRERGETRESAVLASQAAMVTFKVACARWLAAGQADDLGEVVEGVLDDLRTLAAA